MITIDIILFYISPLLRNHNTLLHIQLISFRRWYSYSNCAQIVVLHDAWASGNSRYFLLLATKVKPIDEQLDTPDAKHRLISHLLLSFVSIVIFMLMVGLILLMLSGFCKVQVGSIEGRVGVQHLDDAQQSKNFTFKFHRDEGVIYSVNSLNFHPVRLNFCHWSYIRWFCSFIAYFFKQFFFGGGVKCFCYSIISSGCWIYSQLIIKCWVF